MAVIDPDTGEKVVQELKGQGPGAKGQGEMDLDRAREYFDLSVNWAVNSRQCVIQGVPKGGNRIIGKIEFHIDAERWVPVRISMYGPADRPMSETEIEYAEISGAWVQKATRSTVNSPIGMMKIETENTNIKVNQGVQDKEFDI